MFLSRLLVLLLLWGLRRKQVFKSACCCHQGRAEMCRSEYHLPWERTEGSCVGEKSKSLKKAPEILSGTISIETSAWETGSRHLPLHIQTLISCGMWYHQERFSFISGSWPTMPSTVFASLLLPGVARGCHGRLKPD